MNRSVLAITALALASGCSAPQPSPTRGEAPIARLMPNLSSPVTVKAQCDAADLAFLVGKPRTQIPVPVEPGRRRVACSTCPMAEDYRPDRTDILYDARTGVVISVTCG